MKKNSLYLLLFISYLCQAQFAGKVGTAETTAMYKDSSAFVNWAVSCQVSRGYRQLSNISLGYAVSGNDSNATKKAGVNPVVSLGDGGFAVLTFESPIINGMGFDFAVFENSFNDTFLELAFVEVSSDGVNFFRFPATSLTQTLTQIGPFDDKGDPTKIDNLAGKYRGLYGTPFDLEVLSQKVGLDVNHVTHVKIIDVVGSVSVPYATYDQFQQYINDPFPTPFDNGGFDLDAVGVIHQLPVGIHEQTSLDALIQLSSNPTEDLVEIRTNSLSVMRLVLSDMRGNVLLETSETTLSLKSFENGCYLITLFCSDGKTFFRKIIKS